MATRQIVPPVVPIASFPRPMLPFSSARRSPGKRAGKRYRTSRYTIRQAFDFFYGPDNRERHRQFNDERALRAVAFLLTYGSDIGNEFLDGNAANGLARILELCAERMMRDKE